MLGSSPRRATPTGADLHDLAETVGWAAVAVAEAERSAAEAAVCSFARDVHRLLGAKLVLAGYLEGDRSDDTASFDPRCEVGWATGDERAGLVAYQEAGIWTDPMTSRMVERSSRAERLTFVRRELVDDHEWYPTRFVGEHRATARIDDMVQAVCRVPTVSDGAGPGRPRLFIIGAHREPGDLPFGRRERDLLDAAAAGLHPVLLRAIGVDRARAASEAAGSADPAVLALPPRLRELHRLLVSTDLRPAELAERLGVKTTSAREYVKRLYKRLGVSSRAELMLRAGPCPPPPSAG